MKLISWQAIYVLWLREIKKFWRFKSRTIGSIVTPLFFLIFLGFGLSSFVIQGDVKYISFLVPGIIGMNILFSSVFGGVSVIIDRQFGFLKEIMVAPVSRFSIALGRIAGGATTALIQGSLLILITFILGFETVTPYSVIFALIFMIAISSTFIALGLIIATRMKDTQGFQLIVNFVIFPLLFLSGALYPINNLPNGIKYLSYIDPLTYGVDGLRGVLIGVSSFSVLFDLFMILAFAFVFILISSYLFEKSKNI